MFQIYQRTKLSLIFYMFYVQKKKLLNKNQNYVHSQFLSEFRVSWRGCPLFPSMSGPPVVLHFMEASGMDPTVASWAPVAAFFTFDCGVICANDANTVFTAGEMDNCMLTMGQGFNWNWVTCQFFYNAGVKVLSSDGFVCVHFV